MALSPAARLTLANLFFRQHNGEVESIAKGFEYLVALFLHWHWPSYFSTPELSLGGRGNMLQLDESFH